MNEMDLIRSKLKSMDIMLFHAFSEVTGIDRERLREITNGDTPNKMEEMIILNNR